jgi:hypothetical protein
MERVCKMHLLIIFKYYKYSQTCIKRLLKANTQNGRLMKRSLKTKHDKKSKYIHEIFLLQWELFSTSFI